MSTPSPQVTGASFQADLAALELQNRDIKHLTLHSQFYALSAHAAHTADDLSPQARAFITQSRMSSSPLNKAPIEQDEAAIELCRKWRSEGALSSLAHRVPKPEAAQIEHILLGGVHCYWVTYPHIKSWKENTFLVHMHGGSYGFGDITTHAGVASYIAMRFNAPVLFVEYNKPPEFPLPKAIEDTVAVHEALLAIDPTANQRLVLVGESAGGGGVLLTGQMIRDHKLPKPAAIIALSPWSDLTGSGASMKDNLLNEAMIGSPEEGQWESKMCLGFDKRITQLGLKLDDPKFSPLFGSFADFPPLLLVVGGHEMLLSDSERVYEKAKAAGVDVALKVGPKMFHNYIWFSSQVPEADADLVYTINWLKSKVKSSSA